MNYKKGILTTVMLIGGFFILQGLALAANSDIVINEIAAYPTSTHEWIEIWNKGSDAVDLSGWKFWEDGTRHGLSVSTTDSVVSPGEYAVICQNDSQFLLDYPAFIGSVFDSSWSGLSESGEEIGIKDADDNFVEQFTYPAVSNYSLERVNPFEPATSSANWSEHASGNTVGAQNSNYATAVMPPSDDAPSSSDAIATATVWALLRLNEIVSDSSAGNEWVELFNPSSSSFNLAGGYLCDSRGSTSTDSCKDLVGTIGASGYFVFDWAGYYLNNDVDSVYLKNPEENIVDEISYSEGSAPEKGESLARSVDGAGEWAITTQITTGASNVIVGRPEPIIYSGGNGASSPTLSTLKVEGATTSTKNKTTTALKKAPVVNIYWKVKYPTRINIGEIAKFDAAKSLDPRGGKIDFSWDMNEGKSLIGSDIDYVFASSGVHDIVIRATSTAGTVDEKRIKMAVYPTGTAWGAGVELGAVLPNPAGEDDEWVMIKNIISSTINISNWKILSGNQVYQIPTDTMMATGSEFVYYKTITKLALADTGDSVELRDGNDVLVDMVEYGRAKESAEYVRKENGWQWVSAVISTTTSSTYPLSSIIDDKMINDKGYKKVSAKPATVLSAMSIVQSRESEDGVGAVITGIVTVLPGIFGSQYFYISDGGSGMQIYQNKKDFPSLALGDKISVRGILSTAYGARRIKVKNQKEMDILSTNNLVTPLVLSTGELGEDNFGSLVKISGEITEIKSNFMYVDDGDNEAVVYFKTNAQIDKKKFKEGERVEVMGILEQAKTGLQIWPRAQTDIVSLGIGESLVASTAAGDSKGKDLAETYLTVTAGGITTLLLGLLARARGVLVIGGVKRVAALGAKLIKRG